MSFTLIYLNHFPFERVSIKNMIPLSCVVLCVVEYFLLHLLLNRVPRAHKFLSSFLDSILALFDDLKAHDQVVKKKIEDNQLPCSRTEKIEDEQQQQQKQHHICSREDAKMVMARLGILCNPEEDEKVEEERLDSDDLSNLFEEKEPSLEEVKAAFDVFDENGDGFIDSKELQRVLCALGFKEEGSEMENCKRMISAFDDNGDDRIDFGEFAKFMENTFC